MSSPTIEVGTTAEASPLTFPRANSDPRPWRKRVVQDPGIPASEGKTAPRDKSAAQEPGGQDHPRRQPKGPP